MWNFRESNKSFNIYEDLLKTITIYKFNVDHSNPQDRKKFLNLQKNCILMFNKQDEEVKEIILW